MQVNSINYSQNSQTFGAIKYNAAKDTLYKTLNSKQLKEFQQIVRKQADNTLADIVLFGRGKKLEANVFANNSGVERMFSQNSQRFFESPLGFVKRMAGKADKFAAKSKEMLEKQAILDGEKLI